MQVEISKIAFGTPEASFTVHAGSEKVELKDQTNKSVDLSLKVSAEKETLIKVETPEGIFELATLKVEELPLDKWIKFKTPKEQSIMLKVVATASGETQKPAEEPTKPAEEAPKPAVDPAKKAAIAARAMTRTIANLRRNAKELAAAGNIEEEAKLLEKTHELTVVQIKDLKSQIEATPSPDLWKKYIEKIQETAEKDKKPQWALDQISTLQCEIPEIKEKLYGLKQEFEVAAEAMRPKGNGMAYAIVGLMAIGVASAIYLKQKK